MGTIRDYDTYIFDLDGTLLDTLGDLAASVNYALQRYGLPQHSRDEVRRMVGNGVRMLMERAVTGGSQHPLFAAAFDAFRQHYMEHSLDTTCPYEGITEMLTELKKQGKHTAVVSNKFDAATKSLCQHFFSGLVDVAIGESEHVRKKPAPDTVLEVMRQVGATKEQVVYIGDSDVDIATAANCGIPCISVLWGFRDRDFLLAHGATSLVEKPSEILE